MALDGFFAILDYLVRFNEYWGVALSLWALVLFVKRAWLEGKAWWRRRNHKVVIL